MRYSTARLAIKKVSTWLATGAQLASSVDENASVPGLCTGSQLQTCPPVLVVVFSAASGEEHEGTIDTPVRLMGAAKLRRRLSCIYAGASPAHRYTLRDTTDWSVSEKKSPWVLQMSGAKRTCSKKLMRLIQGSQTLHIPHRSKFQRSILPEWKMRRTHHRCSA